MKKIILLLLIVFAAAISFSQVTYIGITGHNSGSGTFNLFDHYVAVNQNCYINWEVYSNGLNGGDACGTKTQSRLVLRRMDNNDPSSVVASLPIYVTGICAGKTGNNDNYYANLSGAINLPGRYSVEIQADVLPALGTAYDNSNTATTWNYQCPPAYYLTGTGGTTGLYYTAPGSCNTGGLSDPVGGTNIDKMNEIFSALKYFTVGEVGVYRQMVVINDQFFDLTKGKFQPGNPTMPASLNGIGSFPTNGICSDIPSRGILPPTANLGAEINIFKRTDCSADVTGAKLYYRLFKQGTAAPAYASFDIGFKDNCPGNSGPEGNIFPVGGSCNSTNNVLDQRWQSLNSSGNILPPLFTPSDAGTWNIQFYIDTYAKDCAGTAFTITSETDSTTFTVLDPNEPNSPCSNLPILLNSFTVSKVNSNTLLQWQVTSGSVYNNFIVERSVDGVHFNAIGNIVAVNGKLNYSFTDLTYSSINANKVFYRIKGINNASQFWYSSILRVNKNNNNNADIKVIAGGNILNVNLLNLEKGEYSLSIIGNDGSLFYNTTLDIEQTQNSIINKQIKANIAQGIYFAVLRNKAGELILKRSFFK